MNASEVTKEPTLLLKTKQCLVCDIPALILVLLLPITMITLANSRNGMFIGFLILVAMSYGVFTIYQKLYNKQLIVYENKIVYENAEYSLNDLKNIQIEQGLISKQLDIGELKLFFNETEISIHNVKDIEYIKEELLKYSSLKEK